jgi:hypothetical protein
VSPATAEKTTLLNSKANRFRSVRSTARFASADTMKSAPTTIMTVEAIRAPRTAAAISTAAVTTETVDSSPLEDIPRIGSPLVEKNASPSANPRIPNTRITAATATAPIRWTVRTRVSTAPSTGSCRAGGVVRREGR